MKLRIQILLFICFVTIELHSQSDFRPGYIINSSGDIISGLIDYRGELLMGKVCRFKLNQNDKVNEFKPGEIVEYKFDGSKYFVSKEIDGQKLFLQFLIKGEINIYSVRAKTGDRFFIEKNGLGLSELPYEEGIKYKGDTPYTWKSTAHLGLLHYYMQDVDEFQARINEMHKPKEKWLVDLAEDYHYRVCKDADCIVFEKKLPFIKADIEIASGINYLRGGEDKDFYVHQNEVLQKKMQFGVLANLWLPTVNEKLFLRTGIVFSTYETENNVSRKYYKFPIQIEYIYPRSFVNPKLAYGISIYKPFNFTVSLMPGINIAITRSLCLEINCDIDFLPNNTIPLIPSKIYTYGFLAGLYIKL
jgi:hypothetical protein